MKELLYLNRIAYTATFKWVNRRSQRRSYAMQEYYLLWQKYIEPLKIYVDIWEWNGMENFPKLDARSRERENHMHGFERNE